MKPGMEVDSGRQRGKPPALVGGSSCVQLPLHFVQFAGEVIDPIVQLFTFVLPRLLVFEEEIHYLHREVVSFPNQHDDERKQRADYACQQQL